MQARSNAGHAAMQQYMQAAPRHSKSLKKRVRRRKKNRKRNLTKMEHEFDQPNPVLYEVAQKHFDECDKSVHLSLFSIGGIHREKKSIKIWILVLSLSLKCRFTRRICSQRSGWRLRVTEGFQMHPSNFLFTLTPLNSSRSKKDPAISNVNSLGGAVPGGRDGVCVWQKAFEFIQVISSLLIGLWIPLVQKRTPRSQM